MGEVDAMKLTLILFGQTTITHHNKKYEAINYAMTQAGLKTTSGHAMCLRNYNNVNFPGNAGSAKIEE
jgi:hypothetical protein